MFHDISHLYSPLIRLLLHKKTEKFGQVWEQKKSVCLPLAHAYLLTVCMIHLIQTPQITKYSYSTIVHYFCAPSTCLCTVPMFILYCVVWYMLAWAIDLCLRVPLGWDFVTMATFPMASQIDLCIVCSRRVLHHIRRLYYNCCHRNVHKNCTGLWGEDFEIATQDTSWYCVTCMESFFAFNHFDNDTDFLKAIADMSHQEALVQLGLRSKLFNPFEMNEDEHEILN